MHSSIKNITHFYKFKLVSNLYDKTIYNFLKNKKNEKTSISNLNNNFDKIKYYF